MKIVIIKGYPFSYLSNEYKVQSHGYTSELEKILELYNYGDRNVLDIDRTNNIRQAERGRKKLRKNERKKTLYLKVSRIQDSFRLDSSSHTHTHTDITLYLVFQSTTYE